MKRVFVNGYGSIGNRIAQFIKDDPQIKVVGVGKFSPDDKVNDAIARGFDVYVPQKRIESFKNYKIKGTIEDAISNCDLVIDGAPGGIGYANKKQLYEPKGVMAIYQGGESVFGDERVSDLLFNSRVNYKEAFGKKHVMQGSCNVTGMGRILQPLREKYGSRLVRFDAILVRRWADLEQTDKSVPDTVEWSPNPHHQDDVKFYMGKDTPLFIQAIKVPTRQMHVHMMSIRFKDMTPNPSEILDLFKDEHGVATLWTAKGTKQIRDAAESMKFSFKDTNMIHIHANMMETIGDTIKMVYSDDQTGIVIPENHMLMQAMLFQKSYEESFSHTESLFHMEEKKKALEAFFAKK
ncbi:type II glyceraldehyde-3-phosphate dehydrogenase [Candidatus Nitrosotenuis cloacae]|uniref:Glyceraldehyde-3-phosphate dehydrogenase n=1 Tax=Candidatus Nitrosotenuis cloacae TaxID=1603555 RepID=A0A3G1B345_9ARCH|nr:type II glyceraldehyde-3-phosphate dehydrogenase [Candidatus Nitrosotenuis cloacae]AJZ75351.1 glyceraldehyde-3-phosphate dehydrogenase [Candidatus Nitrosotenuis cloacae]